MGVLPTPKNLPRKLRTRDFTQKFYSPKSKDITIRFPGKANKKAQDFWINSVFLEFYNTRGIQLSVPPPHDPETHEWSIAILFSKELSWRRAYNSLISGQKWEIVINLWQKAFHGLTHKKWKLILLNPSFWIWSITQMLRITMIKFEVKCIGWQPMCSLILFVDNTE